MGSILNNILGFIPANVRGVIFNSDLILIASIILILAAFFIPMPVFFLDILLTISITVSIIILLVALSVKEPLDFSLFPFVLLMTTIFRLSLNVATTRVILSNGHEGTSSSGAVIQSFGEFVAGGNVMVGIILFLIFIIINFVVITKGATRVAEVAARFTLDSMPGKQMAIDADLNAGSIDDAEATIRRTRVRQEAEFYGAMDGAAKFVRGDSIAGLLITSINIIAGVVIGVTQFNMGVGDALGTYAILTVGDGLVSQIPAIIVSVSTGIIVTREASDDGTKFATTLAKQLAPSYSILMIAGGIMTAFAIIPGMPKLPFFMLGGLLLGGGWLYRRQLLAPQQDTATTTKEQDDADAEPKNEEDELKDLLSMDTMELTVGYALIQLVDESQGGSLLTRIKSIRRQIASDLGFIVPPVRIKDNLSLDVNSYQILIKGVNRASGTILPSKHLAMEGQGSLDEIEGVSTKDPAYGLDAKWIDPDQKDLAESLGMMVVDSVTVISTHLAEVVKANAKELLGRQEVQTLLDNLKEQNAKMVEDALGTVDMSVITRVLQNLLEEKVSIRNIQTILETLSNYGEVNKDVEYLTEKVRYALRHNITEGLVSDGSVLKVFTLPSALEHHLAKSIQKGDEGNEIIMDPTLGQRVLAAIGEFSEKLKGEGLPVVLVISPPLRFAFYRFVSKYAVSDLHIISHNEISETVKLDLVGRIEVEMQGATQ